MKRVIPIFIVFVCTLSLCGCDSKSFSGSQTAIETEYDYHEIPFSDFFMETDEIETLDICDQSILFVVYERIHDATQTQIPKLRYKYLCKYDFVEGRMDYQKELKDNDIVISGLILNDDVMVYCTIDMLSFEENVGYTIYHVSKNSETIIDQGSSEYSPYTLPSFLAINDTLLYSYCDESSIDGVVSFGINGIETNLDITRIYKQHTDESNSLISTELKGNGKSFIYFTEENNQGVFLIGNETDLTNKIRLDPQEKVDSYCLIEYAAVFTFEIIGTDGRHYREVCSKNFYGNEISRERVPMSSDYSFYRMTSDHNNTILCIDNHWDLYCIRAEEAHIRIAPISLPENISNLSNEAFSIYNIDRNMFGLYFYDYNAILLIKVD